MQIEIENKIIDVLEKLRAQAAAQQMPFDTYLGQFVEADQAAPGDAITLEEFDRILDEVSATPPNAPPLPTDFSRADIYTDHD